MIAVASCMVTTLSPPEGLGYDSKAALSIKSPRSPDLLNFRLLVRVALAALEVHRSGPILVRAVVGNLVVVHVVLENLLAVLVRPSDSRASVQQIDLLEGEALGFGDTLGSGTGHGR